MPLKSRMFLLAVASLASGLSIQSIAADPTTSRPLPAAGDCQKTAASLQAALKRNPQDLNSRYRLGCAYMSLNQNAAAEIEFRTCLRMDPDGSAGRYSLQCLERLQAAKH